jgi:integrase
MGRPLSGGLRFQRGTWWASLPDKTTASGRRYESFLAEGDARAWLAQAVAAVQAGRPLPDAERFRTRKRSTRPKPPAAEPAKIQSDVASVAKAWMSAAYEDLRRGGPDRAERVRRIVDGYLVPWFAPRTTTVSDVTYLMAHEWVLHLIGRQQTAAPSITRSGLLPQSQVDPEVAELTLAEAARAAGVSVPTVRRRWRDGHLPGAYRDNHGQIRVPTTALGAISTKQRQPTGLSRSYVADALWVLRQVLAFARANGLFPAGFDPTEGLEAPAPDPAVARTRAPRAQPRPLTLPECARVAGHLHPVHQIVFWLQRIMGLRISETYGILVSDLVDLGSTGMLAVQGQGGRTFNVRDDHGKVVAAPHKQTTKTAAGSRVLVVPEKLMDLIRIGIEAFHTDPDTGEVETAARLVPGIHEISRAGQAGYIGALEEATAAESLGTADLGFRVSSHLLRKSLATDLAWESGIEDPIRRRFMGHRAGDDVYGRVYTLDHPEVAPLVKVAAVLDDKIASSITTLVTPTTRQVQWGRANPLAERDEHIKAVLGAAGWLVDPGDPDDPLCDAKRVADELGIAVMTARRWMADGIVAGMVLPDSRDIPRRFARLSTVWATRDRLAERVLLPDLAEQLGLRYHELYHMVRRLDLNLELYPGTREYQVTSDAAAALRVEHARIRALHRRSMKLAAAARRMKVAASTASLLARRGDLVVDPETDSSGAVFVSRESVEQCWIARAIPKRRRAQTQPGVPIAEVSRFTGHRTRELMDLVRAGVLEQVPGRRACQLTSTSLAAWIASQAIERDSGNGSDEVRNELIENNDLNAVVGTIPNEEVGRPRKVARLSGVGIAGGQLERANVARA